MTGYFDGYRELNLLAVRLATRELTEYGKEHFPEGQDPSKVKSLNEVFNQENLEVKASGKKISSAKKSKKVAKV